MKNYNYPYKYALMPIYKQTGWRQGMYEREREYGIVAYVAMECFVKSKHISYEKKEEEVSYQVYFEKEDDFKTVKEPSGTTTKVRLIFDTLEEALLYEDKANEMLIEDSFKYEGYLISEMVILKQEAREKMEKIVSKSRKYREPSKQKTIGGKYVRES